MAFRRMPMLRGGRGAEADEPLSLDPSNLGGGRGKFMLPNEPKLVDDEADPIGGAGNAQRPHERNKPPLTSMGPPGLISPPGEGAEPDIEGGSVSVQRRTPMVGAGSLRGLMGGGEGLMTGGIGTPGGGAAAGTDILDTLLTLLRMPGR